jgi:hypothetical protein
LLQLLALAAAAPLAVAQSFNIDVGDNLILFPTPQSSYGGAASQPGLWNDVHTPYDATLLRLDGSASAVTTSSTSTSSFNYFPSTLTGDDYDLMVDIQDLPFVGGPWTWTFDGLLDGDYAVYTYAWAPENSGSKTHVEVPTSIDPPQDVGGSWSGGAHTLGLTYALHRVSVTNQTLTVLVDGVGGNNGSVNAFQLVLLSSSATTHCSSRPTSVAGCLPTLTGPATVTAGAGPTSALCGPTPGGGNGLLMWNQGLAASPPLLNFGFLCIQAPPRRAIVTFTTPGGTYPNCDGQYVFDVQALVDTAIANAQAVVGDDVYIQTWYRDTQNPFGANFSNAWGPIVIQ